MWNIYISEILSAQDQHLEILDDDNDGGGNDGDGDVDGDGDRDSVNLGCRDEGPVKAHEETLPAEGVDDHGVVHLRDKDTAQTSLGFVQIIVNISH